MASLSFNKEEPEFEANLDELLKEYNTEDAVLDAGLKNFLLYIVDTVKEADAFKKASAQQLGMPDPVYIGVEYVVRELERKMKKAQKTLNELDEEVREKTEQIMTHINGENLKQFLIGEPLMRLTRGNPPSTGSLASICSTITNILSTQPWREEGIERNKKAQYQGKLAMFSAQKNVPVGRTKPWTFVNEDMDFEEYPPDPSNDSQIVPPYEMAFSELLDKDNHWGKFPCYISGKPLNAGNSTPEVEHIGGISLVALHGVPLAINKPRTYTEDEINKFFMEYAISSKCSNQIKQNVDFIMKDGYNYRFNEAGAVSVLDKISEHFISQSEPQDIVASDCWQSNQVEPPKKITRSNRNDWIKTRKRAIEKRCEPLRQYLQQFLSDFYKLSRDQNLQIAHIDQLYNVYRYYVAIEALDPVVLQRGWFLVEGLSEEKMHQMFMREQRNKLKEVRSEYKTAEREFKNAQQELETTQKELDDAQRFEEGATSRTKPQRTETRLIAQRALDEAQRNLQEKTDNQKRFTVLMRDLKDAIRANHDDATGVDRGIVRDSVSDSDDDSADGLVPHQDKKQRITKGGGTPREELSFLDDLSPLSMSDLDDLLEDKEDDSQPTPEADRLWDPKNNNYSIFLDILHKSSNKIIQDLKESSIEKHI